MKSSTLKILQFIWMCLCFIIGYYANRAYHIGMWKYLALVSILLILGDILFKKFITIKS